MTLMSIGLSGDCVSHSAIDYRFWTIGRSVKIAVSIEAGETECRPTTIFVRPMAAR